MSYLNSYFVGCPGQLLQQAVFADESPRIVDLRKAAIASRAEFNTSESWLGWTEV